MRTLLLLSLLPLALLFGCGGCGNSCGPGTHEEAGRCVPNEGPVSCGPGTHESNGQCLPDGTGTPGSDGGTQPGPDGGTQPGTDGGTGNGLSCGPGTHQEGRQCLPGEPIDAIEVAPQSATTRVGRTAAFTAVARYQGAVVNGVNFTWATAASAVATIDSQGVATGVGTGQTQVTASARGVSSAAATLTIEAGPAYALSNVEPANGPGGTPITLSGTSFGPAQGATRVLFGTTDAAEVLSWSNTRIVVRVPYGLPTGQVSLLLADTSGTSNTLPFSITASPYVASLTPSQSAQGARLTLRVSGANLGSCSLGLNRGGAPVTEVTVDNTSRVVERSGAPGLPDLVRINMEVLSTALPGELAVSCGGSTQQLTADNRFTVLPRPGNIAAAVGTGTAGANGDGGPAHQARLSSPTALVLGSSGELYISDTDNHRIRVANLTSSPITLAGVRLEPNTVATLAGGQGQPGNTEPGSAGDNGPAVQSQLNSPGGMAFDSRGLLFIADANNHCVRVINLGTTAVSLPAGALAPGAITRVAGGCGQPGYAGDDGPALPDSRFNRPMAVAVDSQGLLYVADTGNHRVRVINTSAATVTNGLGTFPSGHVALVAGSSAGSSGNKALAGASTQLNAPSGLLADSRGLLFVTDTNNNQVRVINTAQANVTFGGPLSTAGGLGTTLQPGYIDVAVGAAGAAGFSGDDWYCSRLFDAGRSYYGVPCAPLAKMASPVGLATGPFGELFIADRNNHRVRFAVMGDGPLYRAQKWFHPNGVDTLAGSGNTGSGPGLGDNGPALSAELFEPQGVAYHAESATLYVADTQHHRIRRVVMDLVHSPYSGELGPWPTDLTSGTAQLDVDTGILSYTVSGATVERRFGATGGIFSFSGRLRLFAGVTLEVVGSRPAVLASTGDMEINGTVHALNGGMPRGPGVAEYFGAPGHGVQGPRANQCDASYITDYGGNSYGNAALRPLTGGTGTKVVGGGLLLSAGKPGTAANLTVAGEVNASSRYTEDCTVGGAGGGLKLVATGQVSVSGTLKALPGSRAFSLPGGFCCNKAVTYASGGGPGRIRLEAPTVISTGTVDPAPSIANTVPAALPWM
jgi:hypothetical protein